MRSALQVIAATILVSGCLTAPARAEVVLDPPQAVVANSASVLADVSITAGGSGAPAGFSIQWMKAADFDARGGWPLSDADPALHTATFLGTPTLNTVEGTVSFMLDPYETAVIQLGDLFDETGVLAVRGNDELVAGTRYMYRVRANGSYDGGLAFAASPYGGTSSFETTPHDDDEDCVHSEGHWKSHPEKWPVSSMRLGTIIYTKAQLISILSRSAQGNGLVSLAHELIAAKLNVFAGAQASVATLQAIADADLLIGSLVVPPVGNGFLNPDHTNRLTDTIEDFSSDEDEHECVRVVSVRSRSWGQVKSQYR